MVPVASRREDEHRDALRRVERRPSSWRSSQGPATDIYALGLVTVYMLAGRPIFEGNDVRSTFGDRIKNDALVTRLLGAMGFTEATSAVLIKAMASAPERRHQDALGYYNALRRTFSLSQRAQPPAVNPWKQPDDITMSVEYRLPATEEVQQVAPPERAIAQGVARARLVDVIEKVDLTMPSNTGVDLRFRVAFLPSPQAAFRINIKGLNCFLKGPSGRHPAIAADLTARSSSSRRPGIDGARRMVLRASARGRTRLSSGWRRDGGTLLPSGTVGRPPAGADEGSHHPVSSKLGAYPS